MVAQALVLLALAVRSAGASAPVPRPRSDVAAYLATVNDRRKFGSDKDDQKKLVADVELAVKAYRYLR